MKEFNTPKELFKLVNKAPKKVTFPFDKDSKMTMFSLGMMFAAGKFIEIENISYLNKVLQEDQNKNRNKSFNLMVKFWQDRGLSPQLKATSEQDRKFLICPVREETGKQKEEKIAVVKELESKGFKVHFPNRPGKPDTNQDPIVNGVNTGGYNICLDNAKAIAKAHTVSIYYDRTSMGSIFDLGVTYYLQQKYAFRNFEIVNPTPIKLDENDFGDSIVLNLLEMTKNNTDNKEITA